MESDYIGVPSDFTHMEGVSVDFKKTFDLNGTDNDEMLRLYLRKAGLSDEIECLSPEQRRAFIYDIIKSNKMPGYWMPSTMRGTMSPPGVRPPLRISGTSSAHSSPSAQRRNEPGTSSANTPTLYYATMSSSSSSNSLQSLGKESAAVPQRFVPAPTPAAPPSPTTFVTKKGSKYEISGPINFQHLSGDMTRDMTRNAFDLSLTPNDNVLKKYMLERGITEEDISGMRKPDLIRAIVQSKFTWMPPKRKPSSNANNNSAQIMPNPNIAYGTISKNTQMTPPSSPPPPPPPLVATPAVTTTNKPTRPAPPKLDSTSTNFTLVTSRFADPSQFPSPESIYGSTTISKTPEAEVVSIRLPPLPPQALRPAPPPRKSKTSFKKSHAPPPPPSAVTAKPISSNIYHAPVIAVASEAIYETIPAASTKSSRAKASTANASVPAPPPPPPQPMPSKSFAASLPPPPPPAADMLSNNGGAPKAPPPPPPMPPPDTFSPTKSEPVYSKTKVPSDEAGIPPPPPPPPPMAGNNSAAPVPPPPPPVNIPPPKNNSAVPNKAASPANAGVDPRDAFLESIRQGVTLKKVNQKAATVSGAKPRAERKPPVTDFLSELKMGLTLRRVKDPEQNPYVGEDPDESHA